MGNTYVALLEVHEVNYMGKDRVSTQIHIVTAENRSQAEQKLDDHYSDKAIPYDVSYWFNTLSFNEQI